VTLGTPTNATLGATTVHTLTIVDVGNSILVTGADAGGGPHVRVFDGGTGEPRLEFFAYTPGFLGGVRVATGDVNGDGNPDIITAAGPGGGPHVRVFDGRNGSPLPGTIGSFFAYHPGFTGGVFVAAGDVNGDGRADVITGAGAGGGPHVKVFSGADGSLLSSFFAYHPGFTGGVHVGAGDVNGDGRADVITGAGTGGGPHVRVFQGATPNVLREFFAYNTAFTGGVWVAAGDINGDGRDDVITGAGPGGGPHVRVFSGADGSELRGFFPYNIGFTGGVSVAAGDLDADGRADIITGAGPGGGPHVLTFSGRNLSPLTSFFAYPLGFTGGVFVGAPNLHAALRVGNDEGSSAALRQTELDLTPADAINSRQSTAPDDHDLDSDDSMASPSAAGVQRSRAIQAIDAIFSEKRSVLDLDM
jgi:hypothetical protein